MNLSTSRPRPRKEVDKALEKINRERVLSAHSEITKAAHEIHKPRSQTEIADAIEKIKRYDLCTQQRFDADDVNELCKAVITGALGAVPYVGGILCNLAAFLWPTSGVDIWDEIRQKVEEMIDRKIADLVYSLIKAQLNGLSSALDLYITAISGTDNLQKRMQFTATNTLFVGAAPEFQNSDYQWVLAPLFAIFAVLHMSLLRDCSLHGKDWGWDESTHQAIIQQAVDTAKAYADYLQKAINDERGWLSFISPTDPGEHRNSIWDFWAPFEQRRILLVSDYQLFLPYLDPVAHPGKTSAYDLRGEDVYSMSIGTADDWDATCKDWGGDRISAPFSDPITSATLAYIEYYNKGPRVATIGYWTDQGPKKYPDQWDRVNHTDIIANTVQGVEKKTFYFDDPSPPRCYAQTYATVLVSDTPRALLVHQLQGETLELWKRTDIGGGWLDYAISGRMLTTYNMWSHSWYYDFNLGCMILGFSRDWGAPLPAAVQDLLWVTSLEDGPTHLNPAGPSEKVKARRARFLEKLETLRKSL